MNAFRRLRKLARAVSGVAREDQRERGASTSREKEEELESAFAEAVKDGWVLCVYVSPFFLLLVCLIEYVRTGS